MPSPEHERMVARIVAEGMRTPEAVPDDDTMAVARAYERDQPVIVPARTTVTDVDAGGVPAVWVVPDGTASTESTPVVVYLHGGGYLWMSPWTHLPVLAEVARHSAARCLGLHYRRGPEDPFPAAVDDVVVAYRWLLGQGVDPGSVVLCGDSASGPLVICALIALRDAGLPLPAGGACVSPWTDLAATGASADAADDPVVSGTALRAMAAAYLSGTDPRSPTASPLDADLRGLPPLHVQVGTRESLLDDARRLVTRARAAGVDTDYVEHEQIVHMWVVFDPEIPESQEAFHRIGEFVSRRTQAPGT